MSHRDDDPIFQDGDSWYFWDEEGTKFLGPFPDHAHAEHGIECYERYLAYGEVADFLAGTSWHNRTGEPK